MQQSEFGKNLKTGHATHAGMTGKHNEDFFGIFAWKVDDQRDLSLGVVADGVGGQTAGEVASHLTVNTIKKYFDEQESIEDINYHLERAILIANRAVYQATQENSDYQGMSTTVALAAILNGRLYTAHVGDSRIYLLRDGNLHQLSVDHTWAQEAIEAGLLTPQEAKVHPNRNVIRRHLGGGSNIEVDHRMALPTDGTVKAAEANQGTSLKPGDTILICSDGLSDMISDQAILESLLDHFQDLPAASKELVDKANQAGGKDNITIVLMQVPGKKAPAAAVVPPRGSAVAAGTTAAGAPSAAVPASTTSAPAAKSGIGKGTWILIGVIGLLLLVLIATGLIFVFSNSLRSESTPAATVTSTINNPDETLPAGAPATAAILATAESATGTADSNNPVDTPGLIPTLRSTTTPTRIRRATSTATSPPPAAASATSPASSGGSGGSSSGSGGSDPATSEPPTSEPPTSEPPTAEPPTSEPPPPEPPPPEPPPPEPQPEPPPDPKEDSPTLEPAPVEPGE
ncbi:MAG: protein phosphatase 2C domain-containing protein [Chloroflexota bacterium]|jgi:protein phosphatase